MGMVSLNILDFGLFTYSQARLLNLLLLEIQLRLDGFPCVSQVPTDGQHSFPSPHLGQALGGSPPVGVGAWVAGAGVGEGPDDEQGTTKQVFRRFFPHPLPFVVHSPPTTVPTEQISVSPGSFLAQTYLSMYVTAIGLLLGALEGDTVGSRVGLSDRVGEGWKEKEM